MIRTIFVGQLSHGSCQKTDRMEWLTVASSFVGGFSSVKNRFGQKVIPPTYRRTSLIHGTVLNGTVRKDR